MSTVKNTSIKEHGSEISWYIYYEVLPGMNFVASEEILFNLCNL